MQVALKQLTMVKKEKADSNNGNCDDSKAHTSLFHHILGSEMPESELSDQRLAQEAQVLMAGGTASTARTIAYISYYILAKPHIRSRLREELKPVMTSYPQRIASLAELEKLPYLQALIREGLR